VVSFTHRPLYPSGTHWMGDCVDPRAGLDAVVKKKFPVSSYIYTQLTFVYCKVLNCILVYEHMEQVEK